MSTIEEKVSDAILQATLNVKVGETVYEVAPPTIATLIQVSKKITQLPAIKLDENNILLETLFIAKDTEVLGEILAVIILGAKPFREKKFSFIKRENRHVRKQRVLAEKILYEMTPQEVNMTLINLLSGMNIDFFFGTITSLLEVNLLRKTKG